MKAILKRVLTGLVGGPLIVLLIAFGQEVGLLLLILTATTLGLFEFYRLTLPESRLGERLVGIGLGLCFPLGAHFTHETTVPALMAVTVIVLFFISIAKPGNFRGVTSRMAVTLLGIVYVGFLLSHILLVRKQPLGTQWVFFLLITVWAGDTSAYFTGTLIGKHKLYPRISPKKSVEGLLGGITGSIGGALLFWRFFFTDLGWSQALILAFFIMILGQLGDFGESMIKRSANVKDSSRLIPGHGGILDRLDSFLFSAPFLYYYVQWLNR